MCEQVPPIEKKQHKLIIDFWNICAGHTSLFGYSVLQNNDDLQILQQLCYFLVESFFLFNQKY